MLKVLSNNLLQRVNRYSTVLIAIAFAISGVMPIILSKQAGAATITSRKVTIGSSQPDATGVTYTFSFTTATAATIQSIIFQFCDTPLGTCVLPGTDGSPTAAEKIDVSAATTSLPASHFTGTTNNGFAEVSSDSGACTEADGGSGVATMSCANRTQATSEAAGAKTFVIDSISNPIIPSGNNEEVYVRITTFSDTAFATPVDTGTVAASIVNQLTVTGRVQERLVFCVFALDDAAGSSGTVGTANGNMPTNCAANEANAGTNVDIGVVDNSTIAKSPVNNSPPSSLGNDRFGAAMINTNASNGVVLTYYPTAATSGTNELRSFRVAGANCTSGGASLTDQCFVDASTTGEAFTAGTERFGLQIPCIVDSSNVSQATGTTANLGRNGSSVLTSGNGTAGSYNSAYANADGDITDVAADDDCENSDTGNTFAWDDSGTPVSLISSLTVVDDEMVKLRYGATANATTPTGTYTVATTYIATPTF